MIRGAIFDIDGTILDSMGVWMELGERYLTAQGKTPEPGLGDVLFPLTLEQGAEYLRAHYGLSGTAQEVKAGILGLLDHFYRHEVAAKPKTEAVIRDLHGRGVPMVLATTGSEELADAALRRLGLRQCFQGLLTAAFLGTSKSEPLIYQRAAELLGTAPEDTAVFEDTLHAVRTAKGAGFYVVGVFDTTSEDVWHTICELADETIRT